MLRKRIAIDLGTANTLVWVAGEGIVANEPTVVAVTTEDRRVVAVGEEAKRMLGRTPESLSASRPMREGVIADYQVTKVMLRYFIEKVTGRFNLVKPDVMVCVPAGCTQVERRAALDATLEAGAAHAYLIDEPLAAAIGANIPVSAPSGHMIVDDNSWLAVRTTPGITGFVGVDNQPTPLADSEVQNIQKFISSPAPRFKTKLTVGEAVKITDGPFTDFLGTVSEVDEIKGKVKVSVSIFGRETPVELDFLQVIKV